MDRDSSVGIATRYWLDGPGIEYRWWFSAPVQTGTGTQPSSYTMGTGSFPGVKQPGRDFDHAPHLAPVLKKEESYTCIPPVYSLTHSMIIRNFSTNTAYNAATVQWNGRRLPCKNCNEAQMTAIFSRKYRAFIICCYKLPGLLEKAIFSYLNLIDDMTEGFPDEIFTEVRSTEQTGCKARTLCRRNNFQLSSCLSDKMSWTPLGEWTTSFDRCLADQSAACLEVFASDVSCTDIKTKVLAVGKNRI